MGSILPVIYNNGTQITQAPGLVSIRCEMIHETRVIPLDERRHAGPEIRSYMGDPRGHWEGNAFCGRNHQFPGRPERDWIEQRRHAAQRRSSVDRALDANWPRYA
jgi:hypothetical protein